MSLPPARHSGDETVEDKRRERGGDSSLARGTSVGRYVLLDRLGAGGMGVVYKSYDPELDRLIALKLLQATGGVAGSERLLREAQALARLQHPNVISVHDVGLFGGAVFIAMEFVDGRTLRRWLEERKRSHEEILEAFLGAGEGLAAAHHAGLVHRDFKPDNVIVGGDGRARVLDFGLARAARGEREAAPTAAAPPVTAVSPLQPHGDECTAEERRTPRREPSTPAPAPPLATESVPLPSDSGRISSSLLNSHLTRIGAIIGTPRFMAPEQHLDDPVDERADQFGFCVSLYWALYGDFPFAGDTPEATLESVLHGRISPPPPGATVPRWLRQVIVRGLARRPVDRYPSMATLLSALRADPRTTRRRWLRSALVVVAVAALATAAVVAGVAVKARRAAGEQARLAQQFGQEVERIAAMSRYAESLPLHDTRREFDSVRARMELLKKRMAALGPIAAGPGHEALGRGYLALERYDDARAELESTWATGYRSPDLAFALGLVHGKLYQRALADLHSTGDEKEDTARRAEVARAHRDPALRYLREIRAHEGGIDAPEYVEGLIALYEQHFDDALALAQKTAEHMLWRYEGHTLEGDIHLMAGREHYWKGDFDGALAEHERAGASYRAAADVARSGVAARMGECQELLETANLEVERDRSPESTMKRALAACAQAGVVRPDYAAPVAAQATAWQLFGKYQTRHGADPVAAHEEAIHLSRRALEIDPRDVEAEYVIGEASLTLGEWRMERSVEASAALAQAIEHVLRALKLDQGSSRGYAILCHAYYARGAYEEQRGEDPRSSYRAGAESARKGVELAPTSFQALNAFSLSYQAIAGWEAEHGSDPTDAFNRAVEAGQKVVQISPTSDHGFINLCNEHLNWGEYQLWRGVDPQSHLSSAISACERAIQLDANFPGSHLNLGIAYTLLAAWQLEQTHDPSAAIGRGRAALTRVLDIAHEYPDPLDWLTKLQILEARWAAARGRDPTPIFAAAETMGRRSLALSHGGSPDTLRVLAELFRRRAEWRGGPELAVARDVREGLDMAARALAQNPQMALAAAVQGALHLVAARASDRPAARAAEAKSAIAALEHALTLNGNLAHEYGPLKAEAARLETP